MNKNLYYKRYYGTVEYSPEDNCLHGEILGISSLIMYEAQNISTLKAMFENAVESYISQTVVYA